MPEEGHSEGGPICRLCCKHDPDEKTIIACRCKDGLENVHPSCIEHWIESTKNASCDLCGTKFILKVKAKTWYDWYLENDDESLEVLQLFIVIVFVIYVLLIASITLDCVEAEKWGIFLEVLRFFTIIWWILLFIHTYNTLSNQMRKFSEWRWNRFHVEIFPLNSPIENHEKNDLPTRAIKSVESIVQAANGLAASKPFRKMIGSEESI